jgi:formamidopyrimidine-DNA glycosylase
VPELPEVETVVRSIALLVGRRIVSAEFRCRRVLRGADPQALAARIRGRKIAGIRRYGKFILVSLEGGGYLAVHLGMTGRLLLGAPAGKHTHAVLTLDRGRAGGTACATNTGPAFSEVGQAVPPALLYDDSRQFGCIQFSEEFPERVAKLGPEPLEVPFEDFAAALKRRKTRIKALLLNQSFLRGLGNIYADEALFRAGIHPLAVPARLRGDRARRLYEAIVAVLTEAIAAGGSSISDYVDAWGRKGLFQFSHRVYRRTGQPCLVCGTPIRRVLVAQRSSHFCPQCQKR